MIDTILAQNEARPLLSPLGVGYNALTCPACGDRCGALIEGQCLGCLVAWNETLAEYEAGEADAFWGEAEMVCSTCGID